MSLAASGLILIGSFLLTIQGAARQPLAFAIEDVVNGLPTGRPAEARGVAG
jgi:hypothetical protein